jgi:hypothetical protein
MSEIDSVKKIFKKYAKQYQDKYMDVSLYTDSLDLFCDSIENMSKTISGIIAIRSILKNNGTLTSGQIDFGLEVAIVLSVSNSAIKDLGSLAISGGRSKVMKTLRNAIEVGKSDIDINDIADDIQSRDYVGTASPVAGLNYATFGLRQLYYFEDNLKRRK